MFYDTLLFLFTESANFKVRINACIALMTVNIQDRGKIGLEFDKTKRQFFQAIGRKETIYIELWISLMDVFSKLNRVDGEQGTLDDELQHRATLVHQVNFKFP